jgi:hypothetical protein
MTAEVLQDRIEIYRFKERGINFYSACILKYTGDTVEIKGLSGGMDVECLRELRIHLRKHGITEVTYTIKGREVKRYVK